MKFKLFNSIGFIFLIQLSLQGQDIQGSKDHEIISRYPNSEIKFFYQKAYSELAFPQAVQASKPADLVMTVSIIY